MNLWKVAFPLSSQCPDVFRASPITDRSHRAGPIASSVKENQSMCGSIGSIRGRRCTNAVYTGSPSQLSTVATSYNIGKRCAAFRSPVRNTACAHRRHTNSALRGRERGREHFRTKRRRVMCHEIRPHEDRQLSIRCRHICPSRTYRPRQPSA